MLSTYGPNGDMSHFNPVFGVWHRAFMLSFENSLIAIDSGIDGLPYWDYRRDQEELNQTVDISASFMFTDEYFGDYQAAGGVTNGRFGHWTVHSNASEFGCGSFYQNAFGLLRVKENVEGNPLITRHGGSLCDEDTFSIGVIDAYDSCLNS